MNQGRFFGRIQLMLKKTKAFLKDKNKKNIFRIIKECIIITLRLRCVPTHYFTGFVYRKNTENYLDYLSMKEMLEVHSSSNIHTPEGFQVLDNKLLFHEHFSKHGLNIPKKLANNFQNLLFIEKKTGVKNIEIFSNEYFVTVIKNLFQETGCEAIFIKPIYSSGGHGAIRLSKGIFSSSQSKSLNKSFDSIINGFYIFQENINQHPELSRINASSLNTIRIDTFKSYQKKPEVISAYLRMGRSGKVVDNLMSGGIYAGIDIISGKLHPIAFSKLETGGVVFSKHPDSGVEFKDFSITYFDKVKEMACEAANLITEKLVGWDIAVSIDGPVLIEGNGNYEIIYSDIAYGGYRRNPIFKKAMIEAGLKIIK